MNDETPDPAEQTPPPPRKPDGWELFCSGILRTEFGRRPSRAVDKAIVQLAAEEAATGVMAEDPVGWRERIRTWLLTVWTRPMRPALAGGFALVLVLVAGIVMFGRYLANRDHAIPNCVLTDAANAHWAVASPRPKAGDSLKTGPLHLESGVVELTFADTSKVAVEGPAEFSVIDGVSMNLKSGKISTFVPRRGRGFTVNLPLAQVVDLGTRFGAMVSSDQSSEVDVFLGKVRLTPFADGRHQTVLTQGMAMFVNQQGTEAETALSQAAFPQPNLSVLARPQNCGFDVSGRTAVGEVPVDFGYWSGPAYQVTGGTQDIEPANGQGMLRFLDDPANPGADSEVWQLVDMRPFKSMLAGGNAEADLSALFNRMRGDAAEGKQFGLTLAAFHGSAAEAKTLWATRATSALALTDKELTADDNPATWEKLAVTAQLPPETDFVIVELRAIAPKTGGMKTPVFTGNFADLVDLEIRTPMLPSSIDTGR